ncbi:MAG: hypothetical protein PHE43_02095 [Candidatus Nanoarchaeia archaeon]|nr:hypothetical protein [Candidatus Nanoarchaeia archaeon]
MLTKLKDSWEKLQKSKEYKEFIKKNKDSYLCAGFIIYKSGKEKEANWQIDVYIKETKNIATFIFEKDKVVVKETNEIFQKVKKDLEELKLGELKIDFKKALKIFNKLRDTKYPKEKELDIIVVLQKTGNPCWNITYITTGFNMLHLDIDAITGETSNELFEPVMNFSQQVAPGPNSIN